MTTQYSLNPEIYKVETATISSACIGEHYGKKYLNLHFNYESGSAQAYPAWNLQGLLDSAVNNFIDFLQVNSLEEAKGNKIYALASQSDIFALFNPDTNQFFSLQARFHPEMYSDSLAKILQEKPDLNVEFLDSTEKLLVAFVASMPVKDELSQKMNKIAHNYMQYKHLSETIADKVETVTVKKKI